MYSTCWVKRSKISVELFLPFSRELSKFTHVSFRYRRNLHWRTVLLRLSFLVFGHICFNGICLNRHNYHSGGEPEDSWHIPTTHLLHLIFFRRHCFCSCSTSWAIGSSSATNRDSNPKPTVGIKNYHLLLVFHICRVGQIRTGASFYSTLLFPKQARLTKLLHYPKIRLYRYHRSRKTLLQFDGIFTFSIMPSQTTSMFHNIEVSS